MHAMRHRRLGGLVGVFCWLSLLAQPLAAEPLPSRTTLDAEHTLGVAKTFDRLIIWPVYAKHQQPVGDFEPLDAALKQGMAEVQEVGGDRPSTPALPNVDRRQYQGAYRPIQPRPMASSGPTGADHNRPIVERRVDNQAPTQVRQDNQVQVQVQTGLGDGARVNTLVIANKGKRPILVLAGTIVKGGKQDRQIGQDFVVEPGKQVPVDAFCVEHGRWNQNRAGKATGGKFEAAPVLANQAVRSAGQYEQSQAKVWAKVSEINAAAGAKTASDALTATLDDTAVAKQRQELAQSISLYLDGVADRSQVVGLAYGVDGKLHGVRWFATSALFQQFRPTLINTAALDAATAVVTSKTAPAGIRIPDATVVSFVKDIQSAPQQERKTTQAGNVNVYRKTDEGYGSEALVMSNGRELAVTADFLSK